MTASFRGVLRGIHFSLCRASVFSILEAIFGGVRVVSGWDEDKFGEQTLAV